MIGAVLIATAGTDRWVARTRAAKRRQAMQGSRTRGKVVDVIHPFGSSRGTRRPVIGFCTTAGQWVEFKGDMYANKSDIGRELEVAYDPVDPLRTAVVMDEEVVRAQGEEARIMSMVFLIAGIVLTACGIFIT